MKLGKFRKGQMIVVMTFAIVTLLGVIALCADVGVMYFNHMQLQKGVDAAALAGASYQEGATLPSGNVNSSCKGEPDNAQEAACTYAVDNGLAISSGALTMTENVAPWPTPNIQVTATRTDLPYIFGSILGLTTYKVAAVATAADPPVTQVGPGLFPMGMQCTSPCTQSELVPGQSVPFDVKFTPVQGGAPGNWQWLDNGQGASGLGGAITDGMTGNYAVGATIGSEPGNKGNAGPVKSAFAAKFTTANCGSYDPCANGGNIADLPGGIANDCLVTVPEVDYAGCTGSCSMTIEGFGEVYIEPGSTSTSITACYIEAASAIAIDGSGSQTNLGTTIIRLYQ